MASSLNKVIIIGNVGKDPEIRSTQSGKEIASLVVATSESWKDRSTGEKTEKTEWHRVVAFSEGIVNIIKNYVKKGTKVYLEGSLQTRKWTDNNNQERYTTEVVLQQFNSSLILLSGKNDTTNSLSESESSNMSIDDLDDEIPF
ncbi:MAG: single-stranded DNA-binding protein [Rickettsiales bacterium]|nr:single-stranded DNA-binding protein [Rickettsiales bacterium]